MKRLIIIAAIVCTATMSHGAAASWDWGTSGAGPSQIWYANSTSAKLAENTIVYLFDAAEVSQQDLLDSLRGGNAISGEVKSSKLNSSNKLTGVFNFEHGENSAATTHNYNFYMAVVYGEQVFITESNPVTASALSSPETIAFTGIASATQTDFTANATAAFSKSGWYAAAPEPTSGLMLLLGMGLVALKRKRA